MKITISLYMKYAQKALWVGILFTFILPTYTVAQDDKEIETYGKFMEVFTYIDRYYVDSVDGPSITETAIVEMMKELDPHSVYIPKKQVQASNQSIVGSFVGVGIRFRILRDTLTVVNPIPGGPSEKVGIRAGDQIVLIDEENVAGVGLTNSDVRDRLLGDKGSKVKVQIKRTRRDELMQFTITRDKIPVNSILAHYMIDKKTGYIKVSSFSRTTTDEFKSALKSLQKEGMQNLVLDLQGNGGGLLYGAKEMADQFLSDDKLIVYSEGRSQPRKELRADEKGLFEDGKLIVLVDESSASASEIVTGAIQDWDRGIVVGRRTFGKGLVQRPIELRDGSQIRLTIARYYTPTGRFIQKPYDEGYDAYRKEKYERYLNGEVYNKDSLDIPDSLIYKTKISEREVYGGGGIIPDVFVSIDTSEYSQLFRDLAGNGIISTFAFDYVNQHRKEIQEQYPDFKSFKNNFDASSLKSELKSYAEGESIEFNEDDFKLSEHLILTRLKAYIAQDLWSLEHFYEIINEINDPLKKALNLIEDDAFKTLEIVVN